MSDKTNVVSFEVDGKRYDIDLFDISGVEWREAKAATALKQTEIVTAALADGDFEAIAALLWIVRRRDEPNLDYEDVLAGLSYRSLIQQPKKRTKKQQEADASPPA